MKQKLAAEDMCTGCGACADSCQHEALHIRYDKNGFLRPEINESRCIGCKACERVCPILNHEKLSFHDARKLHHYAAWSNDESVCRNSSSGGVFSQVAINLLNSEDSVVVYGVEATNQNTCQHIGIGSVDELARIVGTKYTQSNAEGAYREIRKHLKEGHKVFFCGTPCQIAGLYAVLGYKDHPNLYTADLLCHGVPSKIAADIATAHIGALCIQSYRDKQEGWCKPGLQRVSPKTTYRMPDGTLLRPKENTYWKCFSTTHRISCTRCIFAQPSRLGDITLGDLWALSKQYPERGELGASLVLSNTAKGEILLDSGKITKIKHDNALLAQMPTYPLFLPGMSEWGQLSRWLAYIKKLGPHTGYYAITLNWRKFFLIIPIKALFICASYFHKRHARKVIRNTKRRLEW